MDWAASLMAPSCLSAPWEMSAYTTCNTERKKKKTEGCARSHARTAGIFMASQGEANNVEGTAKGILQRNRMHTHLGLLLVLGASCEMKQEDKAMSLCVTAT